MTRKVWQIAGGPASRSYVDVFLRYGVGLIGPGDPGPWQPDRPPEDYGRGHSVPRFATGPQMDDIILLRSGISTVRAVGLVASSYLYLTQFDDVNGWDLQHARRVRWFLLPQEYSFGKPVFGSKPSRFSEVSHTEVVDYAQRFVDSPPRDWQEAPLPPLPVGEPVLEEVPQHLAEVAALAQDFARQMVREKVSEDEMIAHFVVPFFRCLGWRPEQIAIKWRYVDVALFRQLPRDPENCHLIVEAKYPGAGIEEALQQGRGYAQDLGINPDILVTDGYRYRLYRGGDEPAFIAYANLYLLKQPALDLFARLRRP
jgi:hypothetical protein